MSKCPFYFRLLLIGIISQWSFPSYSEEKSDCFETYFILDVALCKSRKREEAAEEVAAMVSSLTEKIDRFPTEYRYLKEMLLEEYTQWIKYKDARCFFDADLAYPLNSEDAGRANDLEKSLVVSDCQSSLLKGYKLYLESISQQLEALKGKF